MSVYSVDKDRLKRITKSDIYPAVIKDNISYLKQFRDSKGYRKPRIYAKMLDTYTDENERFLKEYADAADEVGIDEVYQINLGEGNDAFVRMYDSENEAAHQKSLQSDYYDKNTRRACRYPFSHLTIRCDGTVVVCCCDWLKELSVGNVMKHSLKEIWESKTLYDLRCDMLRTKGLKWASCRACEIPLRDAPEDDIQDVSTDRLTYRNEY